MVRVIAHYMHEEEEAKAGLLMPGSLLTGSYRYGEVDEDKIPALEVYLPLSDSNRSVQYLNLSDLTYYESFVASHSAAAGIADSAPRHH